MDFSSISFLLYFLPVFFFFYALTPKAYKNLTLLAGSIVFYAMGEPELYYVLPVSMLINGLVGERLTPRGKKKKRGKQIKGGTGQIDRTSKKQVLADKRTLLFIVALIGNIAVLCFYKISGRGLPLGLSFYTFQVIAYLADVYRGEVACEKGFGRFVIFLGMFPKVGSGPITPYEDVRRELKERSVSPEDIQAGLKLFVLGLAGKVLLADRLGILWHELQVTGYESITARLAWIGALAFSLKLYFDFYGYSLMAIGLGRLLGFSLPANFDVPYMARSVKGFYRKWHITLGMWFRKYVYIPLGGSRKGELRTILNLAVVWALTGFWHGISLNFFLWAGFLLCCIIFERLLEKTIPAVKKMKVLPHLYLWGVIMLSWVCFAITDAGQLWIYLNRMFGVGDAINFNPLDWLSAIRRYGIYLAVAGLCSTGIAEKAYRKFGKTILADVLLAVLFWLCVSRILVAGNNPFMYLNF